MRGNVKKKNSQNQICRQDISNLSENITSDVMLKYQKWQHWNQWSRTSGAVSTSPQLNCTFLFRQRVTCGGNALFFRWLLSVCYIINIWSYSRHLHHMLLRGPSEKVLISRFVVRKSRNEIAVSSQRDAETCIAIRSYEKRKASKKKHHKDLAVCMGRRS